jgi:hypothetical protein
MSNVTLEGIAELLKIEVGPIKETLAEHTKTLALHTAALETLLTEKKNRDDAKTVKDNRLDYLEKWAKQVSQKFGIEFRP